MLHLPALTALLVLLGIAGEAPGTTPAGAAPAIAHALVKADYAAVTARFNATMKAALTVEKLRATWEPVAAKAGKLLRFGEARASTANGLDVVLVPMIFERAVWNLRVTFDKDANVAGLFIVPGQRDASQPDAWRAPAYGGAATAELSVKVGPRALPGILMLPFSNGPFPTVVLVHGSGPQDADESIGPNRTFADLALGLAARGVASLRYEKRTHAFPEEFTVGKAYTVEEETVADAVAAVELAASAPAVDPRRVWVVGHSLGGYLAPRIAARTSKVAGLVILAGPTRPLEDIVVDQGRRLGGPGSDWAARAEAFARAVRDPKLDARTPVDMVGASLPGSYFLDLRHYDPAATAASSKVPIFVLQGERDVQVGRADYDGWAKALAGRADVRLKLYPRLNHLFEEGEGPPGVAEYGRPDEHVAREVIDDVATFIQGARPTRASTSTSR